VVQRKQKEDVYAGTKSTRSTPNRAAHHTPQYLIFLVPHDSWPYADGRSYHWERPFCYLDL